MNVQDHGYQSTELATLPEKPPVSDKPTLMVNLCIAKLK